MEDIKNMDFEYISDAPLEQINGTKYKREVSVEENAEGSPNLKKITVRVLWKKRNGDNINVETSMLINKIEFLPDVASKLLLYVTPYNIILPNEGSVNLIAVVKDAKGNTVTAWDKDITFTIMGVTIDGVNDEGGRIIRYLKNENLEQGSLEQGDIITVHPINGIAKIKLYTGKGSTLNADEIGNIDIKAETDLVGTNSDSVNIRVTQGAVKINLISKQNLIETNTIKINTSTEIIATLVDAKGDPVEEGEAEIIFNVSGEGTLAEPLTITTEEQKTQITLTASNTPGVATVTASANNLLPGTIDIYVSGPPKSIYITVVPNYMYIGQAADVTVTLKDINGITVDAEEDVYIQLSLTGDLVDKGSFDPDSIPIFSGDSTGYSIFTPTGTGNGSVLATATGLTTGEAAITIDDPLVAEHIDVSADPSSLKVLGDLPENNISTITAVIKSLEDITVSNYNQTIIFSTNKGSFSTIDPFLDSISTNDEGVYYHNGEAKVELYSNLEDSPGIAKITVTSDDLKLGTTDVGFYVEAQSIGLTASPNIINAMGKVPFDQSKIDASILDNGIIVENYVGNVIFTINEGYDYARFAPNNITAAKSVENGEATIYLMGYCEPENNYDVEIIATSNYGDTTISGSLYVTVSKDTDRTIEVIDTSVNLSVNKKEVEFDIILSNGNLKVYNILVNSANQKLYDLEIENELLYSGSSDDGTITDIIDTIISEANNPNHIHIIFSGRIDNKNIQITFNAEPECASVLPFDVSTF